MRYSIAAGAVLAASITSVFADRCADGSVDDGGNWYCQEVTAVTYTGLEGKGSYQLNTGYDIASGTCSTAPQAYSGSMSPLDQELAIHLRGPFKLNQFAVYTSGSSSSRKMRKRSSSHKHQHGHQRFHQHHKEVRAAQEAVEKRQEAACEMVTITSNGVVESWMNTFSCTPAPDAAATTAASATDAASTTAAVAAATSSGLIAALNQKQVASVAGASSSASQTSASSSAATGSSDSSSGDWSRVAYYNAASSTASGLTFLNHNGGSISGSWYEKLGGSLSYATEDGCEAAASSTTFNGEMTSDKELIIMSDSICNGDSCGTVFPDGVNYHGFGGANKAFVFDFSMPNNAASNMPAIWALNALITNNIQYAYGDQLGCNCWESGCGEMDIFEVLASGDTRAKSTLHGNSPCNGGDSDYFARPVDNSITVAAVLANNNVHIKVLNSTDVFADFASSVGSSDFDSFCNDLLSQSNGDYSVFPLAS